MESWDNFQKFPSLYQRVRIDTMQIKKKQSELFQSRLQKLLDDTKAGIMYGEWNDNGRLLTDFLTPLTSRISCSILKPVQ